MRIKKIFMCGSFIILGIVALPVLIVIFLLNCIAQNTDKIYLLIKNPMCFLVEILFHFMFIFVVVFQTLSKPNDILFLVLTYIIFFAFDKFFSMLFRKMFISGKNKYYERYRYKKEMDVLSEYLFLVASTLSILYSTTQYTNAFIPILLWYSIRRISNYRHEKKNANLKRQFLMNSFECLREIDEMFLDILYDNLKISDYLDCEKVKKYRMINSKSAVWNISKKRIEFALESLESLSKKRYMMPKEKEIAREEIEKVCGDIVRCL